MWLLLALGTLTPSLLTGALMTTASAAAPAAANGPAGDFNGDGDQDLAIASSEGFGPIQWSGEVNVLYGTDDGLTSRGSQIWHQDVPGIPGGAEPKDGFGAAFAAGDFDGDGYDDLAVGVSGENFSRLRDAGVVQIIYGSVNGLAASRAQMWSQDSPGVGGVAESEDFFGAGLAAGRFNNDGADDLAIAVPSEVVGSYATSDQVGAVNVLYGSPRGISATGNQVWMQPETEEVHQLENFRNFGYALSAGDFNADNIDDLAVGSPGNDFSAGSIAVIYGSPKGLDPLANRPWKPPPNSYATGAQLAAADFNGDGADDLAVGRTGLVNVIHGSPNGLADEYEGPGWTPSTPGVQGRDDFYDGWSDGKLSAADFDGDGFADLVFALRVERLGDKEYTGMDGGPGAVHVLFGTPTGIETDGNQLWSQDSPGVIGTAEDMDLFGQTLVSGDFSGDGYADLAIGVPNEDLGRIPQGGATNVLYGGILFGLGSDGNQLWTQDSPGVPGASNEDDFLGSVLG